MSCIIYFQKNTNQSFQTIFLFRFSIERTIIRLVVSKRTFIQTLQKSEFFGTLAFAFNPLTIFTFSLMADYTHVFHVSCHLDAIFRARTAGSSAFYIKLLKSISLMIQKENKKINLIIKIMK